MPGGRTVVSNTSPLLDLALVERLDLLEAQFEATVVPEHVWEELLAGDEGVAALRELRSRGFLDVEAFDNEDLFVELFRDLDADEAAAITYAIENEADLVLLDERDGRKAARRHGLDVTGVIGVLLRGPKTDRSTSRPNWTDSHRRRRRSIPSGSPMRLPRHRSNSASG